MTEQPDRLILFVDYQNAYKSAREAFYPSASSHTDGQFNPMALGRLIVEMDNATRTDQRRSVLHRVRVYCGLPDPVKDPKGNGARLRQIQLWGRAGVQTMYRPLRNPHGWPTLPEQEKGVDVQLAVDVIRMALQGEYQTGVIFSRDTDLRPVLETMEDLRPQLGVRVNVGAWQPDTGRRHSLTIERRRIYCYYIDRNAFRKIEDATDYTRHGGIVLPRRP